MIGPTPQEAAASEIEPLRPGSATPQNPAPSVLHVITGLQTGGAEMMLFKLLASAGAGPFGHRVLALSGTGLVGDRIAGLGVPVAALGIGGPLPSPRACACLVREVRGARAGLIQGWMPHGNLAALIGAGWARTRTPVVWSIRNALYDLTHQSRTTRWLIRACATLSSKPAAIVYNSRVSAQQHSAFGYDATRATVIPNGFDCDLFQPSPARRHRLRAELAISDRDVVVGMVARYHAVKDHVTFLRAARHVLEAHRSVTFVLAGRGVDAANEELGAQLAALGIGDRVRLLGEWRDAQGPYAGMDIAALSSYTESFPNTLGEAMATGVPCVATAVGDVSWILGDTGRTAPPKDPARLAEELLALIRLGPDGRRELGRKARARVQSAFSLSAVAAQYGRLYSRVLNACDVE